MKRFMYKKDGDYWKWWSDDRFYYCTNKYGEGIFKVGCDRKQLTGTYQFSIRGLSDRYAKRKIHGWMKEYLWRD